MAFQPTFRMVRAEDQLIVDVTLEGMTAAAPPAGARLQLLQLKDPQQPGRVVLTFHAQQVLEYARDAQGVRLFQPRPIFSPPTTVVLAVPKGTAPVPATVAGLLELVARLALVIDGRAGAVSATQLGQLDRNRLPTAHVIAATRAAALGQATGSDVLARVAGRHDRTAVAGVVVSRRKATSQGPVRRPSTPPARPQPLRSPTSPSSGHPAVTPG